MNCDWIARRLNGAGHSYTTAGVIKSNVEGKTLTVPKVVEELQNALKDM